MELALIQAAAIVAKAVSSSEETGSSGNNGHAAFHWGGTISAIIFLILNRTGRRSSIQSSLLVLYLFTSFPPALFKWAIWMLDCLSCRCSKSLLSPELSSIVLAIIHLHAISISAVSRFLLFVITPDWLADGLRESIVGGVLCLIIGVLLVILEIREIGGFRNWECNSRCCIYCLAILLLFLFTILYFV